MFYRVDSQYRVSTWTGWFVFTVRTSSVNFQYIFKSKGNRAEKSKNIFSDIFVSVHSENRKKSFLPISAVPSNGWRMVYCSALKCVKWLASWIVRKHIRKHICARSRNQKNIKTENIIRVRRCDDETLNVWTTTNQSDYDFGESKRKIKFNIQHYQHHRCWQQNSRTVTAATTATITME